MTEYNEAKWLEGYGACENGEHYNHNECQEWRDGWMQAENDNGYVEDDETEDWYSEEP